MNKLKFKTKSKLLSIAIICALSIFSISSIFIEKQIEFKHKTISVFKDGSGFFVKEAVIKANSKKRLYMADNLPKAAFGTFWFFSKEQNLAGVSSFTDTVHTFEEKTSKAVDLRSLLRKNVDKKIEIQYKRDIGDKSVERAVSGKLIWFQGDLITLKSGIKYETINFREVLNIKFESQPIFKSTEDIEHVSCRPILQIDFHESNKKDELEMMYLTKGITWIPGYYIELQKDNKAKIILRSTLINDAEDIEEADVNFVVGVPNFQYANELSPLYGSKEVASFLGKLDDNYQPLQTMNLNQFSLLCRLKTDYSNP